MVDDFVQQFLVSQELSTHDLDLSSVEFVHSQLDSMWMRDYGPLLVFLAEVVVRRLQVYNGRTRTESGLP